MTIAQICKASEDRKMERIIELTKESLDLLNSHISDFENIANVQEFKTLHAELEKFYQKCSQQSQ